MVDLVKIGDVSIGEGILVKVVGESKRGWYLVTPDGQLSRIGDLSTDFIPRRLDDVVRISQSSSVHIESIDLTHTRDPIATTAAKEFFRARDSLISRMNYDPSSHRIGIACVANDANVEKQNTQAAQGKEMVYAVDLTSGTGIEIGGYSELQCIRWSARGELCCGIQTDEGLRFESRDDRDGYHTPKVETLQLDWEEFGAVRDISIAGEANDYVSIIHEVDSESDPYATQEALTVVASKTGERRDLGPIGSGSHIAWCHRGTKGIVVGTRDEGSPLLLVDPQSGQRRTLMKVHEGDDLGEISYPSCQWLDDGRHVICPSFLGSTTAVYLVNIDTNEVFELMRFRDHLVLKAVPVG